MQIDKLASIIAPIATPLAPAVTLMAGLHAGMVATGINTYAALVPAVASGVGMEFSGMLAGSMTFRAIKERDVIGGVLAALGVVGYVWFAADGMRKIPNSGVFQSFVLMSLISYFSAAIYQYFDDKSKRTHAVVDEKLSLLDAETKLQEARNKGLKLAGGAPPQSESYTKVSETFGRDWRNVPQIERQKIAAMSTREIQQAYRVSERTAQNWKNYSQESGA